MTIEDIRCFSYNFEDMAQEFLPDGRKLSDYERKCDLGFHCTVVEYTSTVRFGPSVAGTGKFRYYI